MALNMLFDSGVSHSAVMEAVHALGAEVIKQTQAAEKTAPAGGRRVPECLTIEGDAFIVKQKHEKKTHSIEVHHYRVYEREKGADGKFKVVRFLFVTLHLDPATVFGSLRFLATHTAVMIGIFLWLAVMVALNYCFFMKMQLRRD